MVSFRRRAATVTTREVTEVFIVNQDDYQRLLKPITERDLKEKIQFLSKALIFKDLPKANVQSLAYLFLQKSFPTNSIIVNQVCGGGMNCHIIFASGEGF